MHNSDILCAQETHFSSLNPPKCSHENYPQVFTANAESKTKGVLINIKDSVAFKLHEVVQDPHGRFLILLCDLNTTTYTIINVCSPNKHQIRFFNKLMKKVRSHQKGLLIMCWDFNVTPDPSLDSTSHSKRSILAQNLKGHRYKTKIPYIIHPGTKQKEYHPQKIADAFSFYYSSLFTI